ncbi:adenosylcobinamide-phosphate synthase CbiB [Rhabdothermincola sp.]|uniref:adenosylcobinamide-phosphate synthase CbiB n=1 Tax=Rhabdothermincola sp. TaxID=2820405 RepID=UPI002FE08864
MSALGAAAGVLVDQLAGEPPTWCHPVAGYGTAMARMERRTYRDRRWAGALHLLAGVGTAVAAGRLLDRLLGRTGATLAAVAVASSGRMLDTEALAVAGHVRRGELELARDRVRSLVGRDPSQLDASELCRAAVESVAENLVDAVIGPLWWGAVAGPAGALGHRAVNTSDAMIGHLDDRYRRFGWAAARADDVVNYLPARAAVAAVCAVRPHRATRILAAVRQDAPAHPSPNGGVIEAAFAAALGIRLGGTNRYGDRLEQRGILGVGPPPGPGDVERAVRLRRQASAAAALTAVVMSAVAGRRRRRRSLRAHATG